jgi:hypothetical protein
MYNNKLLSPKHHHDPSFLLNNKLGVQYSHNLPPER